MGIGRKVALVGFGLLTACGTSAPLPKKAEKTVISSPFSVVQYDPAEGAGLPSSVNITFNKAELNYTSLAALTHYNLICSGITHAANTVTVVSGYNTVVVNLPIINGLQVGSTCTFWLASGLQDAEGNPLGGIRSVTYRVN